MDTRLKDGESSDINLHTQIWLIISYAIMSVQWGHSHSRVQSWLPRLEYHSSQDIWTYEPVTLKTWGKMSFVQLVFCLTGWKLVGVSSGNWPWPFLVSPFWSLLFPFQSHSPTPTFCLLSFLITISYYKNAQPILRFVFIAHGKEFLCA